MSGKRILIVEDNPMNRRLAQFLLRSRGYEVWEAVSVVEALALLRERRPDLILMDIQLPEVDGLEGTRRVKGRAETRDIPIIAVTSYAMRGDDTKALAAGCEAYITKPIDKRLFLETVEKILATAAAPPTAGR